MRVREGERNERERERKRNRGIVNRTIFIIKTLSNSIVRKQYGALAIP